MSAHGSGSFGAGASTRPSSTNNTNNDPPGRQITTPFAAISASGSLDLDMDLDSAIGGGLNSNNDSTTVQQQINIRAGEERDADGFLRSSVGGHGSTTFGQPGFEDAFYSSTDIASPTNTEVVENTDQRGFVDEEEDLTDDDDMDNEPYSDADGHIHYEEEEADYYEDDMLEDEEIHIPEDYGDEDIEGIDDLDHVHDNPHSNCIVSSLGMKSPAIREMNENEIYARRAGLRYSSHGYDVQSEVGSVVSTGDHVNTSGMSDNHSGQHHGDNMIAYPFAFSPSTAKNHTVRGRMGKFFNKLVGRHAHDSHNVGDVGCDPDYNGNDMLSETSEDQFDEHGNALPPNATHLRRSSGSGDNLDELRLLAGQLNADWGGEELMAPALARRLRDFQFAQEKRRKKYGNERPWGILGLYDHLAGVRMDVEWAEDAAWRRANGEPYCAWTEFESSKNQGFNRPFFTYLILIVCTGILIASIGVNGWVVEPVSINPMIGPSAETLVQMGAKETYLIVNENEAWRLVSPMVLHAGLIHFFLNMLALWFIGSAVEQSHGFIPALVLFIIPAIGGTVLSAMFLPEYISVGASGGIFGLIGACLSDIIMNWNLLFSDFVNEGKSKKRHALVLLLLFLDIIVNCLLGLTPFVDNFTHLGGMVYGFLCGLSTMERVSSDFFGVQEQKCWSTFKNIFARFFGLIVSIGCIMATTIILLEGDGVTNPCEACSALSCVPFPPWSPQDDKWWYCDDCGAVTADARVNPATGIFHQLDMTCPDGSIENIDLEHMESKDKAWLESNLPTFCRKYCPSTTKS